MNIKKILPWICFGVSLLFFILGWVFPQASRWLYLPALLGYAGCTAMLGLGEWEKSHKIMAIVWWVIALMAAVLGIVQAAVSTLVFSFNPLFFIIVLLLSIILGWEEKPKAPKTEEKEEDPKEE
jgi:hypothetical protein